MSGKLEKRRGVFIALITAREMSVGGSKVIAGEEWKKSTVYLGAATVCKSMEYWKDIIAPPALELGSGSGPERVRFLVIEDLGRAVARCAVGDGTDAPRRQVSHARQWAH